MFQLTVAGHSGAIGPPAARHVVKELSLELAPVRTLHLSTAVWTAMEMVSKLESALRNIAPSTVSGCHSLIGQTAARAVMEVLKGEQESSCRQGMEGMIAVEIWPRLRSATHRHVLVR